MRVAGGKSAQPTRPPVSTQTGRAPAGRMNATRAAIHAPLQGALNVGILPVGALLPLVAPSHRLPSFAPPGQGGGA